MSILLYCGMFLQLQHKNVEKQKLKYNKSRRRTDERWKILELNNNNNFLQPTRMEAVAAKDRKQALDIEKFMNQKRTTTAKANVRVAVRSQVRSTSISQLLDCKLYA